MTTLEEGTIYERVPMCPKEHVGRFYVYQNHVLLCRNNDDQPWVSSMFQVSEIAPWLQPIIPEHLRVSEGL